MDWAVLHEDYHRRPSPATAGITERPDELGWLRQLPAVVARVLRPYRPWPSVRIIPLIVAQWVEERLVVHREGLAGRFLVDARFSRALAFVEEI